MKSKQNLEDTIYLVKRGTKSILSGVVNCASDYFWKTTAELKEKYTKEERRFIKEWYLFTSPFYINIVAWTTGTLTYLNRDRLNDTVGTLALVATTLIAGIDSCCRIGEDDDIEAGLLGVIRGMWQEFKQQDKKHK